MRIIIVGAGIGGLSAYHGLISNLPNDGLEIKIFESHSSPFGTKSIVGGGLGLAPNGIRALNGLAPEAVSYIQDRAFAFPVFTMRNAKGEQQSLC